MVMDTPARMAFLSAICIIYVPWFHYSLTYGPCVDPDVCDKASGAGKTVSASRSTCDCLAHSSVGAGQAGVPGRGAHRRDDGPAGRDGHGRVPAPLDQRLHDALQGPVPQACAAVAHKRDTVL